MTQIIAGCTGKQRFHRFSLATKAARRINRRDQDGHVEPYHCLHCHGFHVGEGSSRRIPDKRREVGV